MRILVRSAAFSLIVLTFGCRQVLSPDEYRAWVQDTSHGLHVKKSNGPFLFDVQFQPVEFLRLNQPSRDSVNDTTGKETQMQYYTLKITCADPATDLLRHGVTSETEYQQRLYYYSYMFQNDLSLEEKGKTYPCVLFHFEQSDLTKERTFILGFETPREGADKTRLVIGSDKFGSLPIKVEIVKEKIPALKV